MINKFNSIFVIFIFTTLSGQFISELPVNNTPRNLGNHQENYIDVLKTSNRFNITHGFSTSMISGKQSFLIEGELLIPNIARIIKPQNIFIILIF